MLGMEYKQLVSIDEQIKPFYTSFYQLWQLSYVTSSSSKIKPEFVLQRGETMITNGNGKISDARMKYLLVGSHIWAL